AATLYRIVGLPLNTDRHQGGDQCWTPRSEIVPKPVAPDRQTADPPQSPRPVDRCTPSLRSPTLALPPHSTSRAPRTSPFRRPRPRAPGSRRSRAAAGASSGFDTKPADRSFDLADGGLVDRRVDDHQFRRATRGVPAEFEAIRIIWA